MVKELFGDNLVAFGNPLEEDAKTAEDLERELITYLEDNSIEASVVSSTGWVKI